MTQHVFPFAYEGVAVDEGVMDVADFAPALLSMGAVLQDIGRRYYGDKARVTVSVRAGHRTGSFETDLVLFIAFNAPMLVDIMSAHDLWEKAKGLLKLIAKLSQSKDKGAPVYNIHRNGDVTIINGDVTYKVDAPTFVSLQDKSVNKNVQRIVAPMSREGIESLRLGQGDDVERITKKEAENISGRPVIEEAGTQHVRKSREATIVPLQVWLDGTPKTWRVREGDHVYFVRMEDAAYAAELSEGDHPVRGGRGLDVIVIEEWDESPEGKMSGMSRTIERVIGPARKHSD